MQSHIRSSSCRMVNTFPTAGAVHDERAMSSIFIRKYVPELAQVPNAFVHEPWKLTTRPSGRTSGRRWGSYYPMPIIDHKKTAAASRKVIEEAHQALYANVSRREDSDDDHMMQMAIKQSVAQGEQRKQDDL